MNIAFFYYGSGAIGLYRAYNPGLCLEELGHKVLLAGQKEVARPDMIKGNDIVVVKNVPTSLMIAQAWIEQCKYLNCKLYIDIDDDYFNVPKTNIASDFFNDKQYINIYEEFLKRADRLIVSTEYLKDKFLKYNPNIKVLQNQVNLQWFKENVHHPVVCPKKNIRIAWGGAGLCHRDEFEQLRKLLETRNIEIDLIGVDPFDLAEFDIDWGRVNIFGWMSLKQYYRFLWYRNYDLMYAPLADNEFNKSKSDIKILECVASCIDCGAVTDGYAYKEYPFNGMDIQHALENIGEYKRITKEYVNARLLNIEDVKEAYLE